MDHAISLYVIDCTQTNRQAMQKDPQYVVRMYDHVRQHDV